MPLIAMNREMGSLGKDVAKGLSEALDMKVQHHELVDHLANRARVRKSHVISFLEGSETFIERLTVDHIKLRVLTADEILSLAESNERIILRGWGATALLKEVPHAVRVCISASRRERVKRMMQRLDLDDLEHAGRIVDQNDEAAQAVMRRHFHIDTRDINEYDVGFNTDRISADQCVDKIVAMVKSEQFAETDASRAQLRNVATAQHVRAALRTHASTQHCWVRVTADKGNVTLEGVVDNVDQKAACGDIALRIKGVSRLENQLQTADRKSRRGN